MLFFSVGGNVCAIGGHPDGSAWAVGIQNPDVESDQAYIKKSGSSGFKRGNEWKLSTLLYSRWKKILSHYRSGYPDAGR